jgi:phage shock protein PspC (stress-responsive transcriptional regulator)
MDDRLYRSRTDRVISGVAGGLAERLDLDPSIVRVVWVVLAVVSGGIFALVYLVMMFVVPEASFDAPRGGQPGQDPWSSPAATGIRPVTPPGAAPPAQSAGTDAGDVEDATEIGVPVVPAGAPGPGAMPVTGTSPVAPFASPPPPGTWLGPDGRRVDATVEGARRPPVVPARRSDPGGPLILGVILILLGAYFLLRQYAPQVDVGAAWPILAVAAGVLLVLLSLVPGRSRR